VSTLHTLYRFYGVDGALLYVGITCDPGSRLKQHRAGKEWWNEVAHIELEQYATRAGLERAERNAIVAELPRYNIDGSEPCPCQECASQRRFREDLQREWKRAADEAVAWPPGSTWVTITHDGAEVAGR
jgi:hypothetical protein